jgi:hypothetical protein
MRTPTLWADSGARRGFVEQPQSRGGERQGRIGELQRHQPAVADPVIAPQRRALGINDVDSQRRGTKVPGVKQRPPRLGRRWIGEIADTWWSNDGQPRRNIDRRARRRHAARCLATTILIIGKPLTHRDHWDPKSAPIR